MNIIEVVIPTTCEQAIQLWEQKHGQEASTAREVNLSCQRPALKFMDNSLSVLVNCDKLSISSNRIGKIAGIGTLKNLRILSLTRNMIRGFAGLETLGDTLEELWISYNCIEKMDGINALKKLRILYMSHNLVVNWFEFSKLQELDNLRDLLFVGNPLYDRHQVDFCRVEIVRLLPSLMKLDGAMIIRREE